MKHNLTVKGLSMSQAQTISNLCNQYAGEINRKFTAINNCTKTFKHNGEDFTLEVGVPIPKDIVDLIKAKTQYHSLQAFLMHNINAKQRLLDNKQVESLVIPNDLAAPLPPNYKKYSFLDYVNDDWGWDQLSSEEIIDYLDVEAKASHIGQFIHKGKILDVLREKLPTDGQIAWVVMKDMEKTPVKSTVHHTSEELMKLHQELSELHSSFEQRVNYYKAKVKNLVSIKNMEINELNSKNKIEVDSFNSTAQSAYNEAVEAYQSRIKDLRNAFETERLRALKVISALKIDIPQIYQELVNTLLNKVNKEEA